MWPFVDLAMLLADNRTMNTMPLIMTRPGKALTFDVTKIAMRLLNYCREHDWAGYDPYDALNSRVFRALPFFRSKYCRIAFTQFMKRIPINCRSLLLVPRKRNPKGTALFISALLNLKKADCFHDDVIIHALTEDLIAMRSSGQSYSCWGYSFDWQTRGYLVPEGSPNIICTTFVGNALLDAWECYKRKDCLDHAVSASRFLVERLCDDMGDEEACFNYTPVSASRIHNANLLGAAYVARVAVVTGERSAFGLVLRAVRYSVRKQCADGSWPYGEDPKQRWVDNFHTGYNLCALQTVKEQTGCSEFDEAIRKGLAFYINHFFREDGAPKYFHNRTYPVDIHAAAQSLITLNRFKDRHGAVEIRNTVLSWTSNWMRHEDGYFHYQKHPLYTNRISYMRWSQAWMLFALSVMISGIALQAVGDNGALRDAHA